MISRLGLYSLITIPNILYGWTSDDLGTIRPESSDKIYSLHIHLNADLGVALKPTIDGKRFVFELLETNVTVVPGKSGYAPGESTNSDADLNYNVYSMSTADNFYGNKDGLKLLPDGFIGHTRLG